MFTEQDYRDYFTTVQNAEKQMLKCSHKLLSEVSDADVRNTLNNIRNDELRHLKLVKALFTILEQK